MRRGWVEVLFVDPRLTSRPWTLGRSLAWGTGMDEGRAFAILVDILEIDNELRRIVFGVGEHFGAVERNYVVRDDLDRFR